MNNYFLGMHVGKIIDKVIREKGVKKSTVASKINRTPQALNSILRREYCSTDIIESLSEALDVNLFSVIGNQSLQNVDNHKDYLQEPSSPYETAITGNVSVTIELTADQKTKILQIIGL